MSNSKKRAKKNSSCCCICGRKLLEEEKEAHHIKPKELFKESQNEDRNLMILCSDCHKKVTILFSFSRRAYVTVMNKAIAKKQNPNWIMDKISLKEISYAVMESKGQSIVASLNNLLNK